MAMSIYTIFNARKILIPLLGCIFYYIYRFYCLEIIGNGGNSLSRRTCYRNSIFIYLGIIGNGGNALSKRSCYRNSIFIYLGISGNGGDALSRRISYRNYRFIYLGISSNALSRNMLPQQ